MEYRLTGRTADFDSAKVGSNPATPTTYAGIAQLVVQLICPSNLFDEIIMILDTKQKGNLTELQCITACYELGYNVSIPYGENSRYDFVLDVDGKLLKVQVKTSRNKKAIKNPNDAIVFTCRSSNTNASGNTYHRYTKDQIDYFATYWNGKCYLVSVEECSVEKTLWFSSPANGQKSMISMASDYELAKTLNKEVSSQ